MKELPQLKTEIAKTQKQLKRTQDDLALALQEGTTEYAQTLHDSVNWYRGKIAALNWAKEAA